MNTFLRLILTNTHRHLVRTLIGVAGIAFGVAAMISVVTLLQGAVNMFQRILNDDSEIIVFEKHVSDLFFSSVPVEDIEAIAKWPQVESAKPSLFGLVSSEDRPVIACFGVNEDSPRLTSATWLAGKRAGFDEVDGIVLGSRAAEFLKAGLGDSAALGHQSYRVVGIIRTRNGFEDGGVFMPLSLAQDFFHKEGLASIASLSLRDDADRAAVIEQVSTAFPSLTALETEAFGETYSQFRIVRATGWAVGGCAFLLGGLSVANTMIMSVFGRIRELAILRVNGFSPLQIGALIFGESTLVALSGVFLGIGLGLAGMFALDRVPALQGYVDTQLQAGIVLAVMLLALGTALVGALYPAFYATRIQPAEALRFE